MKSTGIVRRLDNLNRVVIPKEICRTFKLGEKTPMEIYTEGDTIVLKKYNPGCYLCKEIKETYNFMGYNICEDCINQAKECIEKIKKAESI